MLKDFQNGSKCSVNCSDEINEIDIYDLVSTIGDINVGYENIINVFQKHTDSYVREVLYFKELLIKYMDGDNSILELLKSQVSEMADADEQTEKPKEEKEVVPESKEETESEEEEAKEGYVNAFEKGSTFWTYKGNYPDMQFKGNFSIVN